jgi:hypothetical protein
VGFIPRRGRRHPRSPPRRRRHRTMTNQTDRPQPRLSFVEVGSDQEVGGCAALVTSLDDVILTLGQVDRESGFDDLKNHRGWGGFTTQDLTRCRLFAGMVALIYQLEEPVRPTGRPTASSQGHHQPASAAVRDRPANPACRTAQAARQRHTRHAAQCTVGRRPHCRLPCAFAESCGAVGSVATLAPNPR